MGSNIIIPYKHLENINTHRFMQKSDIPQNAEKKIKHKATNTITNL